MRRVQIGDYDFHDFESILIGASPTGFTSSKIYPGTGSIKQIECRAAECRLETADIRYRLDTTNPTGSEGILLQAGETLTVLGVENVKRFRAIKTGAVTATLKVHYGW